MGILTGYPPGTGFWKLFGAPLDCALLIRFAVPPTNLYLQTLFIHYTRAGRDAVRDGVG